MGLRLTLKREQSVVFTELASRLYLKDFDHRRREATVDFIGPEYRQEFTLRYWESKMDDFAVVNVHPDISVKVGSHQQGTNRLQVHVTAPEYVTVDREKLFYNKIGGSKNNEGSFNPDGTFSVDGILYKFERKGDRYGVAKVKQ